VLDKLKLEELVKVKLEEGKYAVVVGVLNEDEFVNLRKLLVDALEEMFRWDEDRLEELIKLAVCLVWFTFLACNRAGDLPGAVRCSQSN
jgi:hypothetical protein